MNIQQPFSRVSIITDSTSVLQILYNYHVYINKFTTLKRKKDMYHFYDFR